MSSPLVLATSPSKPSAELDLSAVVKCPDNSYCPQSATCCVIGKNKYGCCPLPNAVCCADKRHCCAKGTKCDPATGSCLMGSNIAVPWYEKFPSKESAETQCPDGQSVCPGDSTCCLLVTGQYGCCPIPNAVCCKDNLHCCPQGSTCNLKDATCDRDTRSIPWSTKIPAKPVKTEPLIEQDEVMESVRHQIETELWRQSQKDIDCPDKKSHCPQGTTCCKMDDGNYGCCPKENAKCCSDHIHCCESYETCDTAKGQCVNGDQVTSLMKKFPARMKPQSDIKCPDNVSTCPSGTTCCEMQSGYYGCCPFTNAKCCANKLHCCQADEDCNEEQGTCMKNGQPSSPLGKKLPAERQDVVCPHGKGTCSSDQTCCLMSDGNYGCCGYPHAVCCPDKLHCCPHDYVCDVTSGECNPHASSSSDLISIPWSTKVPASPAGTFSPVAEGVTCPDGKSMCENSQTCCKMAGGAYGCCPMPKAVCCMDGQHCCPEGTQCDTAHSRCTSTVNSLTLSWSGVRRTLKQRSSAPAVKANVCADKTECPDDTTCCEQTDGKYACCPHVKATCCPDKVHCCPEGYKCDGKDGKCAKAVTSLPLQRMNAHDKCGGVSSSADTCCPLRDGSYASCPLADAVCCADQTHCCPAGHSCEAEKCKPTQHPFLRLVVSKESQVKMAKKTRADKVPVEKTEAVVCPDKVHQCPSFNTCCRLMSGEWGCCHFPKATCCSDHIHCCPDGYMCDVEQMKCVQGNVETSWYFYPRSRPTMIKP